MIITQKEQIDFLKKHLIEGYEVLNDYVFEVRGAPFLGSSDVRYPKVYKIVFSDVGGVWESPKSLSLTQNWAKHLELLNGRIKNRSDEFRNLLKNVEENPVRTSERLTIFLQDCNLREEQYILACDDAAYDTRVVRNAGKYVDELGKMNYLLYLI